MEDYNQVLIESYERLTKSNLVTTKDANKDNIMAFRKELNYISYPTNPIEKAGYSFMYYLFKKTGDKFVDYCRNSGLTHFLLILRDGDVTSKLFGLQGIVMIQYFPNDVSVYLSGRRSNSDLDYKTVSSPGNTKPRRRRTRRCDSFDVETHENNKSASADPPEDWAPYSGKEKKSWADMVAEDEE